MIKCYMTGVEVDLQDAYVLDLYEARMALRELSNRMQAVEKLVEAFGKPDIVEKIAWDNRTVLKKKQHRLLSQAIASALGEVCPGRALFVPFPELSRKIRARVAARKPRAQTVTEQIMSPLSIRKEEGDEQNT